MTEIQYPAPWWYRLLAWLFPGRCREIPEAVNPTWPAHAYGYDGDQGDWRCCRCGAWAPADEHDAADDPGCPRIVLRQFAIVKRYVYLQQFASAEDRRYMHSHPYKFMIAIGLWGGYLERRIAGATVRRSAPYLYTLDAGHVHHVQEVSAGHTSIFVGLFRAEDGSPGDKRYFGTPRELSSVDVLGDCPAPPTTWSKLWSDHIVKKVKRI